MNEDCPTCGLDFDRGEPGYFTGAMYVSYALVIPVIALLTLIEHLIVPELVVVPAGRPGFAHLLAVDPLDLAIFTGHLDLFRPVFRSGRRPGRASPFATTRLSCKVTHACRNTMEQQFHSDRSPSWPAI